MAGDNPAAETPSQSLETGTDSISQAQAQLDTAGESLGGQEPASVTRNEFDALQAQNRELTSQLRGLQGSLQKTTNSLNDMTQRAQAEESQAFIESLPEDQRPRGQFLQQQVAGLYQQVGQLGQQQQQTPAAQPATQVPEETRQFVSDTYGLDPYDNRINYTGFMDTSKPEGERAKALMDSIYSIQSGTAQQPAQDQQSAQQQQVVLPNPGESPAGTPAGFSTAEDVYRAYVENRVTLEERNQALERMGESIY